MEDLLKPCLTVLFVFCASILVGSAASAARVQDNISHFDDRTVFSSASTANNVIDSEDIAPRSGFINYKAPRSFATRGLDFHLSGGGKFGPGYLSIVGGWYYAGPIYETTTGAKLTWAPPNQPGNANLEITLPSGVSAVGTDLWTAQPYVSSIEVAATTVDGKTKTVIVNTSQRPAAAFVGFTSDTPIASLQFTIPRGQTGLILDNFTFGRSAKNNQPAITTVQEQSNKAESQVGQPATSTLSQAGTTAVAGTEGRQQVAPTSRGTIAYVRGGTEIRLIEPDGNNDRRLWTHKDARKELGIDSVAWRPDGKELAFSSRHAAAESLYDADLYVVRPDGTGFRKLTNAPDRAEFARYPKGSVSVTLRNDQPIYKQSQASAGIFIVYVAGAAEAQQITLPRGATKTLVFNQVADFGNTAQAIVAIWG